MLLNLKIAGWLTIVGMVDFSNTCTRIIDALWPFHSQSMPRKTVDAGHILVSLVLTDKEL